MLYYICIVKDRGVAPLNSDLEGHYFARSLGAYRN